ncbi:hypothetical protein Tco_0652083 [Tanacetum coccineum]|uniref:Uncharacterized protein n=1 Tax=Tanacetum coccineum TaxID=301880 RepID=A0ABQ4WWL2_9ASTR
MKFSGPADNFSNLLHRNQTFSPSKIYDVISFHLNEVYSSSSGEANKVYSLYQHYPFIVMGLNNIRNAIEEVSHSEPFGIGFCTLGYMGKKGFLRRVIGHLDRQCQCQVAGDRFRNMNVWAANLMQHKCKVKADDLGSLYFLQAQALSIYENCNSKKIIWCKQNFTEDIEKALKLEHDENDHGLIEKVISLCDPNRDVLCYDEGERMLLMGKMTREGRECQYHLLKENFELTLRVAKVYTFHMNYIVAARVWSISFEELILAPNSSFICYVNSMHQEATILDLIGDKQMVMSALEWGKGSIMSLSLRNVLTFQSGES